MPPRNSRQAPPVSALATDGRDAGSGWRRYREPLGVLSATRLCDVLPLLAEVRRQTLAGRVAVGWIAYEAAPGVRCGARGPPARAGAAGVVRALRSAARTRPPRRSTPRRRRSRRAWRGGPTRGIYRARGGRIHEHIAAGDTYQVNYTYRLRAPWAGDPLERFAALARAQRSRYAAFIDAGRFAVLSASPELCFRLEGDLLTCRPMKGTAPRGLTLVEDRLQAAGLRASEKERAENVMIVDMVRNDLGRIARVGTVRVPRLWETERYPTLWQMTSTVCAETAAPLDEILLALFPSASITGAPKVRTMQIIKEIERTPRGIYTGCVGRSRPGPARLDERGDPDARRGPPARTRRVRHRQRDRLGRAGRRRIRRVPDQDAGARRPAAAVPAHRNAGLDAGGGPAAARAAPAAHRAIPRSTSGSPATRTRSARASPRRRAACAARTACGCCWTSRAGSRWPSRRLACAR